MKNTQLKLSGCPYLKEFLEDSKPPFRVSNECCDFCKKQPAHDAQKDYEMIITGERMAEGGMRSIRNKDLADDETMCFYRFGDNQFRFRPLYYVSDKDKAWYKTEYGIRYSDAYEVYGLTRTGCCGCPISYKAMDDLNLIEPYEPNVVKAAWSIFGDSYRYRKQYVEYKKHRMIEAANVEGQTIMDFEAEK